MGSWAALVRINGSELWARAARLASSRLVVDGAAIYLKDIIVDASIVCQENSRHLPAKYQGNVR
jgi:hypothetical protein